LECDEDATHDEGQSDPLVHALRFGRVH
jgi:hypothetical protein